MARKFVKATGLHNIFNTSGSTLDITSIKESVQSKVNQNSIVFLTASEDAIYGYPDGTKYIWTMNTLYPTNSYDEIIKEDEEVTAAIISKLNYTIGLDSSANLVWSEESGLTEDTIKEAIEYVSMNAGVKINDSSVNVSETWSSQKISDELNNIDIVQINDSSIDSSMVWSSQKVNNEIQAVKGLPYLKFTANTAGSTIALTNYGGNTPDIKYSRDGVNWSQWDYSAITLMNAGDYVYMKGDNSQGFSNSDIKNSKFAMTGSIASSGNIMSLIDNGACQTLTIPCNYCYFYMFYGCSSLTSAPELPATTLASSCYQSMFYGCSSLTSAPELPATTLASSCYQSMFYNCSSLTSAPELPATTLTQSCYYSMFRDCSSLTSAPELPATILANSCYNSMFSDCSGLTSAPELPATTLASQCYSYMFHNCSRLSYIKCLATTGINQNDSTTNWVSGVASTGTFVKNTNVTWPTGVNGIPEKWNITINDIHNTGTLILHESEDTVGEWNKSNTITINELEYVDLGLPSGTLWGKFNIGANVETESGDYYAWAEIDTKTQYNWNNYKYANGSYDTLIKYCNDEHYGITDGNIQLFGEDDIASKIYWKYKAHIPSYDDFQELIDETSWYYTSNYKNSGIEGMVFESTVNSNSIFIPFGGHYDGSSKIDVNNAFLWLNKVNQDYAYQAETICLYDESYEIAYSDRYYGLNIRPVCKNTHTTFSVGVGNSNSIRVNALEVLSNGDVYIYGLNNYDGTNPTSNNKFQNILNIEFLTDLEIEQDIFGFELDLPYYIGALYIDDFPEDKIEEILETGGYESLKEYLEDAINDKYTAGQLGTNFVVPTLLTMEYDGIQYNLWRFFTDNDPVDGICGLMPINITYKELYQNSMEANINNRYCPFVAIGSPDGGIQYAADDDLDNKYALMHVHIIDKCSRPIDESHSSSFDALFIDNFEDYGIFNSLYAYNVNTIEDYIDTVIDHEGNEYYWDSGDTFEYEGEEYRIFVDREDWGGLVPVGLTYQDLYPDSLEANSDNIKRYTSPFVATFDNNNSEIAYEGIQAKQKHSTLIAVR